MTFVKAAKLLSSGIPIKHPHYGVLYSLSDKESLFLRDVDKYQKVIITGLSSKVWLLQPKAFVKEYNVITSLEVFYSTNKWKGVL